jgi:hypothetical protein
MSLLQPFRRSLRRAAKWLTDRHPSRGTLERFVRGELSAEATSRVFQHLLRSCVRCRAVTSSEWELGTPPEAMPAGYDPMFERVFSAARRAQEELETGRQDADRLAVELEELPLARRRDSARNDARYRSPALFELLLRRSRESAGDPRRAESLGELAVAVAESLGSLSQPPSLVNEDLQAAAWGVLAAARKSVPDFIGAEAALAAARTHLARGTGDRLEKARLLAIEASLREAQGRAEEASRLRGRAEALYRRIG